MRYEQNRNTQPQTTKTEAQNLIAMAKILRFSQMSDACLFGPLIKHMHLQLQCRC